MGSDGILRGWMTEDAKQLFAVPVGGKVTSLSVSPDELTLILTNVQASMCSPEEREKEGSRGEERHTTRVAAEEEDEAMIPFSLRCAFSGSLIHVQFFSTEATDIGQFCNLSVAAVADVGVIASGFPGLTSQSTGKGCSSAKGNSHFPYNTGECISSDSLECGECETQSQSEPDSMISSSSHDTSSLLETSSASTLVSSLVSLLSYDDDEPELRPSIPSFSVEQSHSSFAVLVGGQNGGIWIMQVFVSPGPVRGARVFLRNQVQAHSMGVTGIDAACAPDGGVIVVSSSLAFEVAVWNLDEQNRFCLQYMMKTSSRPMCVQLMDTLQLGGPLRCAAGTADGCLCILTRLSSNGSWSSIEWQAHRQGVNITAVLYLPSSARLVSCGADAMAKVWGYNPSSKGFSWISSLANHDDRITDVAADAEGKYMYTASRDGYIKQWIPETAKRFVTEERLIFRSVPLLMLVTPLLDLFFITIQLLSFPLASEIPWSSPTRSVGRTMKGTTAFSLSAFATIDFALAVNKFYIMTLLALIFIVLVLSDVHERILDSITRLSLKTVGMEAHLIHAKKKSRRRVLNVIWGIIWLTSTILMLPLLDNFFSVFACTRKKVTSANGTSTRIYLSWDLHPDVQCYTGTHLAMAITSSVVMIPFTLTALRYSVVAGDASRIKSPEHWSSFARIKHHFFSSWFAESRISRAIEYAGSFTRTPIASMWFQLFTTVGKILLALSTATLSNYTRALSLLFVALAALGCILQLVFHPFEGIAMNQAMLFTRIFVVWVCTVGVFLAFLDPESPPPWISSITFGGGFVFSCCTMILGRLIFR